MVGALWASADEETCGAASIKTERDCASGERCCQPILALLGGIANVSRVVPGIEPRRKQVMRLDQSFHHELSQLLARRYEMREVCAPKHQSLFWHNFGLWLSLVERLVRDQEAVGSNPTSPIFNSARRFRILKRRTGLTCRLDVIGSTTARQFHHGFSQKATESKNLQAQASQAYASKPAQETFALQGLRSLIR
jgi:hypothetical protein